MRYAINTPNFEKYSDARLMAELAREAEEVGWDGFFIWDHVGAAWPPPQPAFQRQEASRFPRGITILIIILALALVGSGLGFILYSATVQYRTTLDYEATSIALSTVRARAATQGWLQATAHAFATANSNIYATATAQTAESYDRATDLEAIGGRFFTLSTSELSELARAA